LEGLTVDACDHGGAVCLTLQGVAVDPPCLTGGKVRGEAEAGGEALGHAVLCCVWLVYHGGGDPSEVCHHLVHLVCIDGARIPAHPIAGLHEVATDLPVSHAAHELLPGGLVIRAELDTRLSGVVEKFIVADPEGSVPSLVGCPTVVSGEGAGHVVVCVCLLCVS